MAKIKCTVDNCAYWDSGNICIADGIEVSRNFFGDDRMEAAAFGADPIMSNQTRCVTFKPSDKKKQYRA
ncbi:MAG: DUF1540 domain-containing protein [Halanaerobiaceae bacterium]|nr:DUF1540 domain-containing protein [Halanaerobiaceae bacterium]